jgi:hypothetical protein
MSTLCIQIQPNRAIGIDMKRVRALAESLASDNELITRFAIVEGDDRGPYSNLMFETSDPQKLWHLVSDALYKDGKVGPALASGSMAMCEGSNGWTNYLLLYHFDPSVKLDRFEDI